MHRSVDDLGKYAGKSPVHMWTSGAVDMWITVAVQSPCQVPGLSLTPPGDHPAAGMRRSRRPGAARLRCAGERNGARRWPRPDRKSSDTPYLGCANEPRPGAAAEPGYCGLPHGAEASRAAGRAKPSPALGRPGRRRPRRGRRPDRPTRRWTGPARAAGLAGGPGPQGCRTGPSQTASGARSPDRGGRERPRPASGPGQAREG